jgi:endonuclease G, mitochondrial
MLKKKGHVLSFLLGFGVALSLGFINPSTADSSNQYPQAFPILHRKCYTLCYDSRNKVPLWVHEKLTPASLQGEESRDKMRFKEDIDIPTLFRSNLKDYKGNGFHRGHMCPAGDCPQNFESMEETFLLSNIAPQEPTLNQGPWKKLENKIRDLARSNEEVYVYTGPLYLPEDASDGKRYVKYQVIGKNDVAVPTHFFKMIQIGEGRAAYIIPNKKTELSDLEDFEVPVETLEKVAGVVFP